MLSSSQQRREKTRLQRRESFLQAAENLFGLRGFHATTMEDIATEAAFATGTIYRYFPSKEALYHELLEQKLERLTSQLEAVHNPNARPLEQLRTHLRTVFDFSREHHAFLRIYANQVLSGNAPYASLSLDERSRRRHERCEGILQTILEQGMDEGAFVVCDPYLTRAAIRGLMHELLLNAVNNPDEQDLDKVEAFTLTFTENALQS